MEKIKQSDIGYVFLHGAGLGAWIWDNIGEKLDYPFLAIDLPGRGKHISIAPKALSLKDYVESVLSDIMQFRFKKLIIVAHSISGIIGLEIAQLLKNRIYGFVAISASIPPSNNSYISTLPVLMGMFLRTMFIVSGTKPPESAIRNGLCGDINKKQTLDVINRFVPESKRLYMDKLNAQSVPVDSMYVRLKNDRALSETIQDRMIANLGPKQIIDINSGHLPMLSKPDELAHALNIFADQINKL